MDGVALASVVSTGGVALASLIINAVTKRGDRKHEASVEFEKRVWNVKSSALLSVIGTCESIRTAVRIRSGEDIERQKAAIFREFQKVEFLFLTPELIAYAAKSVNGPAEILEHMVRQALRTDAFFYELELRETRTEKESAIDQGDFDHAATLRSQEVTTERLLGKASGIDVAAVDYFCAIVIEQARADLRGQGIR